MHACRAQLRSHGAASPARRAGFTLIEAMISMVILSVGILAVMSMQTASIGATAVSQDFTNTINLGERLLELLRLDALRWNSAADLGTETLMISRALPATQAVGAQGAWSVIPDNVIAANLGGRKVDRNFAPDTQGAPTWALGFRYCLHYRLTWTNPPNALRADVRVAWAKDEADRTRLADCQNDVANVTDLASVRSATFSTLLMVTPL